MKNMLKPIMVFVFLFSLLFVPSFGITITESKISNVSYENYNTLTILAYGGNASYDVNVSVRSLTTNNVVFNGTIGNILNNTETSLTLTPFLLPTDNYTADIVVYNGTNNATVTVDIFLVTKATPNMTLSISPGKIVTDGTVTTVNAEISTINNQLQATLTCPTKTISTNTTAQDKERFNLGTYTYVFSTTGNANYTARSISLILKVVSGSSGGGGAPSVTQVFEHKRIVVHVAQGEPKKITINIEPKNYLRTAKVDKPFVRAPTIIYPGQDRITITIKPIDYSGTYNATLTIYDLSGLHKYPIIVKVTSFQQMPFVSLDVLVPVLLILIGLWVVTKWK